MNNKEQLAREAKNAYQREWARRNRDKVKAAQQRYWLKRANENGTESEGGGERGKNGTDASETT